MRLSTKDLKSWAKPWPIILPKNRLWKARFSTVAKEKQKIKCFWDKDRRVSLTTAYNRIMRDDWLGKRHQIWSISKHWRPETPMFIVTKGVMIDGNHRFLALIETKYRRKILIIYC